MKLYRAAFAIAALWPTVACATDYNLRQMAEGERIKVFRRTLDVTKAGAPDGVFLDAADDYGVAWIEGASFAQGTIEVEVRGEDKPGESFVGIAFHGQDNKTFEAVYLRPFNFRAVEADHRSHAVQYISLPGHDWAELRRRHPGVYESAVSPAPVPDAWVRLRLVVDGEGVAAYVNGAAEPSLRVRRLGGVRAGKVGLWVGNGSDGRFRGLRVVP